MREGEDVADDDKIKEENEFEEEVTRNGDAIDNFGCGRSIFISEGGVIDPSVVSLIQQDLSYNPLGEVSCSSFSFIVAVEESSQSISLKRERACSCNPAS